MLRIVFFGTPLFAATILEYLLHKGAKLVAVVTKPDKPVGRSQIVKPPPVKVVAEKAGLPLFQPLKASSPEFAKILDEFQADLFVVVAYSEIFKENLLAMPRRGCINVHASLLPKYRGAAPIHRAVIAGEKESGVTIMKMAKELDAGDIYSMGKTPISEELTTGELTERLAKLGAEELWKVIEQFQTGKECAVPQDHALATFAPKVTLADGEMDWRKPVYALHNQIRGVTPKPGAWCFVDVRGERKRLLIKKAKVHLLLHGAPGAILPQTGLIIGCGEGALELLEIQLEGKKAMAANQFIRGILKNEIVFILK